MRADGSKKKVFWRRSIFSDNGSWQIGHARPRGRDCGLLYLSSSGAFCVSHCKESALISILSAHGSTFRYHAININVSYFDPHRIRLLLTLCSRAISGGADPHVHLFKRDPQMLDHIFMSHSELNLSGGDMYEVSSFDDRCTIGTFLGLPFSYCLFLLLTGNNRRPQVPNDDQLHILLHHLKPSFAV